jgi:hypothetical protein
MRSASASNAGGASIEHRDTQSVAALGGELGHGGERGQVAEIVTDHDHRAGIRFGDDLADRVAFVAADSRAELPDELASHEL